jgi:hypothetical protein
MTRLVGVGVVNARQACDEAKTACGCGPDLAMKLIDYAVANGKGPGAIVWRFKRAVPSLPIEQGWPENCDDSSSAVVNAEKKATKKRAERADEEAHRKSVAESDAAVAERERRFGTELEAMSHEEVGEICKTHSLMARLFRKEGRSPLVREWLLVQLERRVAS